MASTALRIAAVSALALMAAACSKPADKAAPEAGKAPDAPAASASNAGANTEPSTPAEAARPQPVEGAVLAEEELGATIEESELPRPRAGLWSIVETSGDRTNRDRECETGRPEPLNLGEGCGRITYRRTLSGGYYVAARCQGERGTARVNFHAEGDFRTSYTLDTKLVVTGDNPTTLISHRVATYVGACPADMQDEAEAEDRRSSRSNRDEDAQDNGGDRRRRE